MSERKIPIILAAATAFSLAFIGGDVSHQQFRDSNDSQPFPSDAVIPPETKLKIDLPTIKIPS